MTDRPILFSSPMIRALLAGRKTQTRRVLKPQPPSGSFTSKMRYAVGDRLWVREAWAHYHTVNHMRRSDGAASDIVSDGLAGYRADGHDTIEDFRDHVRLMSGCDLEAVVINGDRWRPSIHMPRWASRLTLTVTGVKVERLQEISEADAFAEGIRFIEAEPPSNLAGFGHGDSFTWDEPIGAYRMLWESIHGEDSWDINPWVAASTFTVENRNIDA